MHVLNGDAQKYDAEKEYERSLEKVAGYGKAD
jgi:hypothetical protein